MNEYNEKRLEDAIEEYLISELGGYTKSDDSSFNSELGLDTKKYLLLLRHHNLLNGVNLKINLKIIQKDTLFKN